MPRWAQVGGRDVMQRRLTGELRGKVREEVKANLARRGGADTFLVAEYAPDTSIEGQRLSALAAKAGLAPEEYALTLLEKDDAGLVSFNMAEDDIGLIMRQPWTMTCTDGGLQPATEGKPHPRAYGAFPRKLRPLRARSRRRRAAVCHPLDDRRSPAEVFGLKDRGVLRPAPSPTSSSSTWPRSRKPPPTSNRTSSPRGLETIVVNGRVVRSRRRIPRGCCPAACCGSNADAGRSADRSDQINQIEPIDRQIDHPITRSPDQASTDLS